MNCQPCQEVNGIIKTLHFCEDPSPVWSNYLRCKECGHVVGLNKKVYPLTYPKSADKKLLN